MNEPVIDTADENPAPDGEGGLDHGTYEVLRARLADHAAELARRAETLNAGRLAVFGGTELQLIGTERIRTEHNCVPRDIVALGETMLFGYNVFFGLKPGSEVTDVFSLHRLTRQRPGQGGTAFTFGDAGPGAVPGLLDDPRFQRDFADMYRYYRQARLLQLRLLDGRLLAVFQTGPRLADIRVLRWRVGTDGTVVYEDNQGERDHVFPASHDVEWIATTRDDHVLGRHPHISIGGEVFVETVGGTLTVKIEDNTETGSGIYSEPVDEPLQSLADAEVHHASVGALILLRIRPYNEIAWRYLVFNTRTKNVVRLDGIAQGCRRLPGDHGIIFPGGYLLDTGVTKTFDTDVTDLEFERTVRSPNGEDVLYVFHARADGRSLLLTYNAIREQVAAPVTCHGFSLFDDGTLVVLRAFTDEPSRVHPMQVWQTPYVSDAHAAAQPVGTGALERVGNADLVRGISDCLSVTRMIAEMAPSTEMFEGLIAACVRAADRHHWLGQGELSDLATPLADVRVTAERVLTEYENVRALTDQAAAAVDETAKRIEATVRRSYAEMPESADGWVARLAELRRGQGRLEALRELHYADTARIDELAATLDTEVHAAGLRTVEFLQDEGAFADEHAEVERLTGEAGAITTVAAAEPVAERLSAQIEGLEVVIQIVGTLDLTDATARTAILERVGEVLGGLNRARAVLENRRRELLGAERRAEFAAEFALLDQAIGAAIATADTPERCDERLGRLLLQVETLEARFADFDDYLTELEAKRTDVYEALSARKQSLLDDRARRAARLSESADRILSGVRHRVTGLGSLEEVNTYFATDAMVARLRTVAGELRSLGEPVRAEELEGRIKSARQEAGLSLRDHLDLYSDGGDTIRLGRHHFAVNTQPIELTLVPHQGTLAFTVTGTDYRSPVRDEAFAASRRFWDQSLVSETAEVYRAEYLAASILQDTPLDELHGAAQSESRLLELVRSMAATRYDEGYERGVHDHDATAILATLLRLHAQAGLLRYPADARAAAQIFWAYGAGEPARAAWTTRAASLVRARCLFGRSDAVTALAAELTAAITDFDGPVPADPDLAGEYLVEELAAAPAGFATSAAARTLLDGFRRALGDSHREFEADLTGLGAGALSARHQLVEAWLRSFAGTSHDLPETIALLLCGALTRYEVAAPPAAVVEELLGTHPRMEGRRLELRLDEVLARTRRFRTEDVPAFRAHQRHRNELVTVEQRRLRLHEYRPHVMSAFVRNRLVDAVYLPLIGDNLAKQLGASGDAKRTDQMGMLLLISPPGYGKTTLMEYVAHRLGLIFVKVNGPALGHAVTSLDPAKAPDATARQEVEKINLALEMGNNVLLHLDDIQHTSPELLQKFIPLCDAQRRIEGVWEGKTRTYDLRGKRFAVCMAGNPYTESGQRFHIPDMLANRADVWNIGDVLSGKHDLFALSYIENALTSNPVLAPLSTHDREDIELLVRLAAGDQAVRPDLLAHPYPQTELDQILSVLRKLLHVREVILTVNRAYIASAAQADVSRTEPPFRLQGSYRDMNKVAERVLPVTSDDELQTFIDDHYLGEAQTLTSGAEANLLKLAELRGTLTPEQTERWTQVKTAYQRSQALRGDHDDAITRAVGAIGLLADEVAAIGTAIEVASERSADNRNFHRTTVIDGFDRRIEQT
ncbi:DNA repair ATPase [Actinomadura sp. HBU206391]|uniref:DNA repair ATPase n=1 Tax=Actinomadura sp. HBU206391 TaxID=2731692 RepID=UPI00290583F2|nr:DNA repair ATPase [Actinomadura sp. HBU206391]